MKGDPAASERSPAVPSIATTAFVAILTIWMLVPFAVQGVLAQDALPSIAAGRLAHDHPDALYDVHPHGSRFGDHRLADAWCSIAPPKTNCDDLAVPYVATPATIPFAVLLAKVSTSSAVLIMRLISAGLLASGMWILWKRLAHLSPHAPQLLIASSILLIPAVSRPVVLGQTSPILFLSVCLGIGHSKSRRSIAAAIVWATSAIFKATPAALGLVLVWRKRWDVLALGVTVVVLCVLASGAFVPATIWSDFVHGTKEFNDVIVRVDSNRSVVALSLRAFAGAGGPAIRVAATLTSLLAAGALCWFGMRRTVDDVRWAVGCVAILVASPLVWWHYVWVLFGALGVAMSFQRRTSDRLIAMIPVAAIALSLPSVTNVDQRPWPVVQEFVLFGLVVAFAILARRSATDPKQPPTSKQLLGSELSTTPGSP